MTFFLINGTAQSGEPGTTVGYQDRARVSRKTFFGIGSLGPKVLHDR
jgi:hypothetical protein